MPDSIVDQMQRAVTDPGDMSDGFVVTQHVTDAMVQFKNHNETKAAELLHQVFGYFARDAYPRICAVLSFDQQQHEMATVSISDFVADQIADSFAAMANSHRACSALGANAMAVLYITALIHNTEYDLTVYLDNQSETWPLEEDEDD